MATINVTLDSVLINNFKGSNDYVYIAAFSGPNGTPANFSGTTASGANYYALISGGVNQSTGLDLELATGSLSNYPANYVIVTTHAGPLASGSFSAFGTLAALTNAQSGNYNYTVVEGDILGTSSDQLDITAINAFGPNVTVTVPGMPSGYSSSTGFHDSFDTLKQNIIAVGGNNAVQINGTAPNEVYQIAGTPPSQSGNVWYGSNSGPNLKTGVLGAAFNSYLTDLSTDPALLNGMMFSSNGGNFLALMRVEFDGNTFSLVPLFQNLPSQPGGGGTTQTSTITQTWISANGGNAQAPFTIENIISGLANPPGGISDSAEAIQMFLGGTQTGMWASQGTYINPDTTKTLVNPTPGTNATVDLSQSWNWAQYYAYDAASAIGQKSLGNSDFNNVSTTSALNGGKGYYDYYAGTILQSGAPYGWAYSDLLSARGGLNPQIKFGLTADESFNLYVWDNSTTPTTKLISPESGYKPPSGQSSGQFYAPANDFELNSHLDWYNPNGGGAGVPTYASQKQQKIVNENTLLLDFRWFAGSQQLAPDNGYPITLRIYNPQSPKAQSDGFVNVPLTQAGAPGDPVNPSPWKTYFLNSDYTTYAYDETLTTGDYIYGISPKTQATGAGYPDSLPYGLAPGQLVIENLPTTEAGTPGWYQLVIGQIGSPAQTVYDIYPESLGSGIHDVTASAVANVYEGLNVGMRGGASLAQTTQLEIGHTISLSDGANNLMNTQNNGITWNPLALFDYDSLFVGIQYQMIFDRAPDSGGFSFWTQQLDAGNLTQAQVTTSFLNSSEMPSLTNQQFVENMYENGFGRSGDSAGITYWTNLLNTQAITRTDLVIQFTNSSEMWQPNSPMNVYVVGNNVSVLEWPSPPT